MKFVSRIFGHKIIAVQCRAMNIIFYFSRLLTPSPTIEKRSTEYEEYGTVWSLTKDVVEVQCWLVYVFVFLCVLFGGVCLWSFFCSFFPPSHSSIRPDISVVAQRLKVTSGNLFPDL